MPSWPPNRDGVLERFGMHLKKAVQNVDWGFEGQHYDWIVKDSVQHGTTCSHTFTLRLMTKKIPELKTSLLHDFRLLASLIGVRYRW